MLSVCCDYCGKAITKKLQSKQKGYKHHFCDGECYGQWKSQYLRDIGYWLGQANPGYGKRYTKQEKQLIGELVKQALSDPQWRAEQSARGKRNMQNPDYVAKLQEAGRRLWENPSYRSIVLSQHKRVMSTDEEKEKRRKATKKMWEDPRYRDKVITGVIAALNKKPNQREKQLDAILQEHFPRAYEYTGDGKLVIGGMIPDFVNVNGKKDVIELFGDYWHTIKDGWKDNELGKIMAYNSFGYRCLVIWEHELRDEQAVVAKVRQFTRQG